MASIELKKDSVKTMAYIVKKQRSLKTILMARINGTFSTMSFVSCFMQMKNEFKREREREEKNNNRNQRIIVKATAYQMQPKCR